MRGQLPLGRGACALVAAAAAALAGCGGSSVLDDGAPTGARKAINGCVMEAMTVLDSTYERIPAGARHLVATPTTLAPALRELCARAAGQGALGEDGAGVRTSTVVELILSKPSVASSLCRSAFIAGQRPPDAYLPRKVLDQLATDFCAVWFTEGYAEQQQAAVVRLGDDGVAPDEIVRRTFSGEFVDVGGLYERHPQLILPFLVAAELARYDAEFTPSEKEGFPRDRYRAYMRELYRRALAQGLLDFEAATPGNVTRDEAAFAALADEIEARFRS